MSKFIPVDPDKWAEMVRAWSDLPRWKEICDELDAECTRIKDENARLRSFCTRTIIPNIDFEAENARLNAEVERLQNNCDYLDQKLDEQLDKSAMLCGQIERLTDAITSGTAITPDAYPHE
jgi:predicted nuclease with TOPRIM domain